MYASKTPRNLNHDTHPFRDKWREDPFASRWTGARFVSAPDGLVYDPRPQFDHVQHNEPNPILVEYRSDAQIERTLYQHVCWWLGMLDENVYEGWTDEQIDHARRVLDRYATWVANFENVS